MNGGDELLKDLQVECLNDSENRFGAMRSAALQVLQEPIRSLAAIQKICQDVKANLISVQFQPCAELFGEFESHLSALQSSFQSLQEISGNQSVDSEETGVLKFFLEDAIQNLEGYFKSLKVDFRDTPERADERRPAIKILASWRPTQPSNSPTSIAPQPAEPSPSQQPTPQLATERVESQVPSNEPGVPSELVNEHENERARHQYLICRASLQAAQPNNKSASGARTFAIPIQQVIEVIDSQTVNPLPYPRPGVAGILNFRGDPLPVLVCYDRGQGDQVPDAKTSYIVIAKVEEMVFGFQMEQVLSVSDLNPKDFQSPDQWLVTDKSSWVTHLHRTGEEVVLVMDLKKAVAA